MAKGKMKAKAEGRCARCQQVYMAMLQKKVSHHSDDAKKSGREITCVASLDQGIGKTTMPKIMRNGPKSS